MNSVLSFLDESTPESHFSLWSIMRAYPLPGCVFIC